jgi:8-oxo-dGTP diphosphatase
VVRVVAAALLRDGRVLAARRRPPHRLAGGWEFPGGKVEPGEDDAAALVRECWEELSVEVAVFERLEATQNDDLHLVLYSSTVVAGEPRPGIDHDELRWLGRADLEDVPWLPIDRALLAAVRPLLS